MTSSQKFSVSLLISVVAFSVFSVLALSGQFKVVEAKFYQPAVRRPIEQKVNELAEQEKQYNQILASRFSAFAGDSAVLTFTKKSPSPEEKKAQEISCGRLISSSPYLLGIRVIEAGGRSIYYSSFESDKKPRADLNLKNYEDYDKIITQADELKFEVIKCPSDKKYSVYYDTQRKRSVYSVPLYGKGNDGQSVNCVIVFYCEPQDFIRYLYSKNIITLSEKENAEFASTASGDQGGFIFGLPYRNLDLSNISSSDGKSGLDAVRNAVKARVEESRQIRSEEIFEDNISVKGSYKVVDKITLESETINVESNEVSTEENREEKADEVLTSDYEWVLFTKWTGIEENNQAFIAVLYSSDVFEINNGIRILLLTLLFITLFLIIYLIFNLRHDDMVVIKDRIRRFQLAFITEYVNERNEKALPSDLQARKEELSEEIKASLGRRGRKHQKEVDELLERNWTEILASLGVVNAPVLAGPKASIDSAELRSILEEILGSGKLKIQAASVTQTSEPEKVKPVKVEEPLKKQKAASKEEKVEEVESVEELDEVEEVEAVEELEEVEEVEAAEELEEAEAVEDLEEVEEAEAVEELDEVEEAESVEELDEVEEAESVEELDEVEEAESVEELDEVEEAEAVEELDEVEEAESVEELDEVEEAEAVEELDEVEEAEAVEELDEVEDAEAAEELEEVEEAESVEVLDEVEEVEAAEELDEVEEAEAAEELDEVEEAESVEELEEVKAVEELDEIENAEAAEKPVEIETVEELDEVEEIAAVEAPEEAETAESVEEVVEAESPDTANESELIEDKTSFEELEEIEPLEETAESAEAEVETVEDDITEAVEEIEEPEEIQVPKKVEEELPEEEMGFGSPVEEKESDPEVEKIVNDFNVSSMDFSFLDSDSFDELDRSAREELYTGSNYETSDMEFPAENSAYTVENIVLPEENSQEEESEILPTINFVSFDDVMSEESAENESLIKKEEVPFEEDDEETVPEQEVSVEEDQNISNEDISDEDFEEVNETEETEISEEIEQFEEDFAEDFETLDEAEGLENLTNPDDSVPFMFTQFAANNNNITELESENADAIVEGEDGTYHIEGVPASGEFKLDSDFKKLVEAVLK